MKLVFREPTLRNYVADHPAEQMLNRILMNILCVLRAFCQRHVDGLLRFSR